MSQIGRIKAVPDGYLYRAANDYILRESLKEQIMASDFIKPSCTVTWQEIYELTSFFIFKGKLY